MENPKKIWQLDIGGKLYLKYLARSSLQLLKKTITSMAMVERKVLAGVGEIGTVCGLYYALLRIKSHNSCFVCVPYRVSMISYFFLKSMRSSRRGSRFLRDPILLLISAAVILKSKPPHWCPMGLESGCWLDFLIGGSGLGVLRGLEPDVTLLPKVFWKNNNWHISIPPRIFTVYDRNICLGLFNLFFTLFGNLSQLSSWEQELSYFSSFGKDVRSSSDFVPQGFSFRQ